MTDHYAVFGNPIAQSLSPVIHAEFARQTGRDICYQRQLVGVDEFDAAARTFFEAGGKGLNVTLPFKLDAFKFATVRTRRALRAGAVNTLMDEEVAILGDNTDGIGLLRDITANQLWQVAGQHVLLVGAGGAVCGVLEPLLMEGPASLTIVNRTVEKAEALAGAFSDIGAVHACSFAELGDKTFDLIINGTSASLAGDLPPLPPSILTASSCCYDMMYSAEPTIFLKWAQDHGILSLADGLGMLVEQAAEAFFLWHGVKPETSGVIKLIRGQLARPG